MAHLLYIESSPRKKRSASIHVAQAFLELYGKKYPHDTVTKLDVWEEDLPPFDGDVIDAKYAIMRGESHTEAERKAWHRIEKLIQQFKSADKYLFSIPMWNFQIPYRLKHYIDLIVQPSYTFSFSPKEGYKGLVTGKPAVLICARGGSYPAGSPGEAVDLQKKYMEIVLGFIGFKDLQFLMVEPTAGGGESSKLAQKAAEEKIPELLQKI